jgi:glucosamine-6-phosphate deaminase
VAPPTVHIRPDAEQVATVAADIVGARVAARPRAVVALPTGRTPIPLYKLLAARCKAGLVDVTAMRAFNLDEWVGVASEDEKSFAAFMNRHFYSLADVPPANRLSPCGAAADLNAECRRYEEAIGAAGGFDLAVLGIGQNGHIGFNEPGTPFSSRTHVVELSVETREANAYAFPGGNVPWRAITVGIATILEAREIVLLATGSEKAEALARALDGPINPALPASALRLHSVVQIVADIAAAARLVRT